MSKGYADYVVNMARLIDREIKRDLDGVEWPIFKDEYLEWLGDEQKSGVGKSSQPGYLNALYKLDEWIFEDHDFPTFYYKAFAACDYSECERLRNWYDELIGNEIEEAKTDNWGVAPKTIQDYRSKFRKHYEFLALCENEACDEAKKLHLRIEAARESAKNLFMESKFFGWCISPDNPDKVVPDTAKSYVSNIKSINQKLFCKTGYDLLKFLPDYVEKRNAQKIREMFTAMDGKLDERIDNGDEREMSRDVLNNCRSALRKYAKFIMSHIGNK